MTANPAHIANQDLRHRSSGGRPSWHSGWPKAFHPINEPTVEQIDQVARVGLEQVLAHTSSPALNCLLALDHDGTIRSTLAYDRHVTGQVFDPSECDPSEDARRLALLGAGPGTLVFESYVRFPPPPITLARVELRPVYPRGLAKPADRHANQQGDGTWEFAGLADRDL